MFWSIKYQVYIEYLIIYKKIRFEILISLYILKNSYYIFKIFFL